MRSDGEAALDIGPIERLVVLVTSTDDVTRGAGGLLHAVEASGRPVFVVTVAPPVLAGGGVAAVIDLLAVLAPSARVEVVRTRDAAGAEARDELRRGLQGLLVAGDTVVAPPRGDADPLRAALGGIAADLAGAVGGLLLEMTGEQEEVLADRRAVRFELAADDLAAKRRTIELAPVPAQVEPASVERFVPSGRIPVDFEAVYAASDDPWGFADRWYERRKRALTVAALPRERYESVLEIGCSIGLLAEALAERADALIATDVADRALELARRRFAGAPGVLVERCRVPAEWPGGSFDLVVLSETGFYLSREELASLADRIAGSLRSGGHVLLCHWRPHVAGLEVAGDEVHEIIRDRLGFSAVARHLEDDFVLEVLAADAGWSVGRATGLR